MTKKKSKKSTPTLKETLIDEAQKLIAVTTINPNKSYSMLKRKGNLCFCETINIQLGDTHIMYLPGSKIKRGLEEYQWSVYGDILMLHFAPKQIECTESSIDESATKPGEKKPDLPSKPRKPLTKKHYIDMAKELLKGVKIGVKDTFFFIERNKELHLVELDNCKTTDNLILRVLGKLMAKGGTKKQWDEAGTIIQEHFKEA